MTKQNNNLKRGAAYGRFSSDMQREESIEAQLRAIHDYAQRNNIIIVEEYIDRAKSATTDQRPEFQRMIQDAAQGEFDVVLVHKLDRFARNRYDSAHYRHQLKRNGVALRSVVENLDDSPESIIMESVLEGMAEYYSKNLAREVLKGMKENAHKGLHTGGTPPLGYDLDRGTKKLVVNEQEAEAVRLIFRRTLEGVGYGEIIDELARLGYRSKQGKVIGKNSLHSLLKNPKYVGDYIYNKSREKDCDGRRNGHAYKDESEWIVVKDGIPPIVSREDFELVQKKLAARKHTKDTHNAIETYLLKGKMFCGVCGGAYIGARRQRGKQSGTYFVHYGCGTRFRQREAGCTNKQLSKPFIEQFVLEHLAEYVFNEDYVSIITDEYNDYLKAQSTELNHEVQSGAKRLADLDKELQSVTDLLVKTQAPTLIERLEALEREKTMLAARLERQKKERSAIRVTEHEVRKLFAEIRQKFQTGELCNIKQIIDSYVDRIIVHPETVEVRFNFFPRINLAMANEKPEGCDHSQPSGSCCQRNLTNVDEIGGEGGTRIIGPLKNGIKPFIVAGQNIALLWDFPPTGTNALKRGLTA